MDSVNDPAVETVVLMKSSQVGGTEILLNVTGYHTHQDPCPILLIEPTLDIAETYSKDRLAPMIRDSPVLTELISSPRAKDGANTLLQKAFAGGRITMGGANSPSGLASRPIRILLCDEVDRYALSAGTEGDPLKLADKRTATFWNRKKMYVSSPGIAGISRIEREFNESDRRYYHVPCHACGEFQKLEWEQVKWDRGRPETAVYVCRFCNSPWNDAERHQAVMLGRWIAKAEFKGTAGFHIWEAYSPWVKLSSMVDAFLSAKHASDMGDNEPLKTFVNTSLGRTWIEKAERANPAPLLTRRENYTVDAIPWPVLYLTAGVDVQDDRLEIEVVGWRSTNRTDPPESWGLRHCLIYGNPAEQQVWDDLEQLLLHDYRTEDGRTLRIAATCVDSGGHHTEAVYRYCNKRLARHTYAIKGISGLRPIWPPRAGKSKKFKGTRVWMIGVDTAKDAIYSRLKIGEPGPGYCHFPVPSEACGSYDETYFRQLTSEQVRTKFIKGHPIREWFKAQGERNEALDLRVYALAALHSRVVPWEILARSAPTEPPEPKQDAIVEQVEKPAAPEKPKVAVRRVRARFGR